jgi:hypothetical protein
LARPAKDAPPLRHRAPNPDDAWCDTLRESCARAMAAHLKEAVNTQREIRSLTLAEMMALAEACTAHWIVAVSQKQASEDLSPTLREFVNLLG